MAHRPTHLSEVLPSFENVAAAQNQSIVQDLDAIAGKVSDGRLKLNQKKDPAAPARFTTWLDEQKTKFGRGMVDFTATGAAPLGAPGTMEVPLPIDPRTVGIPQGVERLPAGPPPTPVARPEPIPQDMGLLATPSPMDLERRRLITQKYLESGLTPPTWASTEELEDFYALRTAPTPPPVEGQVGIPSVEEQQAVARATAADVWPGITATTAGQVAAHLPFNWNVEAPRAQGAFREALAEERALLAEKKERGEYVGQFYSPERRAYERTRGAFPQLGISPSMLISLLGQGKIAGIAQAVFPSLGDPAFHIGAAEAGETLLDPLNLPVGAVTKPARAIQAVGSAIARKGAQDAVEAAGRQVQRAGAAVREAVEPVLASERGGIGLPGGGLEAAGRRAADVPVGENAIVFDPMGNPIEVTVTARSEQGAMVIELPDGKAFPDGSSSKLLETDEYTATSILDPDYVVETLGRWDTTTLSRLPDNKLQVALDRITEVVEARFGEGQPLFAALRDKNALTLEIRRRGLEVLDDPTALTRPATEAARGVGLPEDVAQPAAVARTGSDIEFVENFPLSDAARVQLQGDVDATASMVLRNSGIRQIHVDPPFSFGLSQEAGVSSGGVLRINPTVRDIRRSVLHEAGHVFWERASLAERNELKALATRNIELLRRDSPGYATQLERGEVTEAVAEMFARVNDLPSNDRLALIDFQPTGSSFDEAFPAVRHEVVPEIRPAVQPQVRTWEEIRTGHGYITDQDDLAKIASLHGDRMIGIKDVNGGRSILPASQAARLLEDPLGSGFVREVYLPPDDILLGPARPDRVTVSALPEFQEAINRATRELPTAPIRPAQLGLGGEPAAPSPAARSRAEGGWTQAPLTEEAARLADRGVEARAAAVTEPPVTGAAALTPDEVTELGRLKGHLANQKAALEDLLSDPEALRRGLKPRPYSVRYPGRTPGSEGYRPPTKPGYTEAERLQNIAEAEEAVRVADKFDLSDAKSDLREARKPTAYTAEENAYIAAADKLDVEYPKDLRASIQRTQKDIDALEARQVAEAARAITEPPVTGVAVPEAPIARAVPEVYNETARRTFAREDFEVRGDIHSDDIDGAVDDFVEREKKALREGMSLDSLEDTELDRLDEVTKFFFTPRGSQARLTELEGEIASRRELSSLIHRNIPGLPGLRRMTTGDIKLLASQAGHPSPYDRADWADALPSETVRDINAGNYIGISGERSIPELSREAAALRRSLLPRVPDEVPRVVPAEPPPRYPYTAKMDRAAYKASLGEPGDIPRGPGEIPPRGERLGPTAAEELAGGPAYRLSLLPEGVDPGPRRSPDVGDVGAVQPEIGGAYGTGLSAIDFGPKDLWEGRPRTLKDLSREAKGQRAFTPPERADLSDIAHPINTGEIAYRIRDYDAPMELLHSQTKIPEYLMKLPGAVRRMLEVVDTARLSRDNPFRMAGIQRNLFTEIEKSRAAISVLNYKNRANRLLRFNRKGIARGVNIAEGVPESTPGLRTLDDILDHPEHYVLTAEQEEVLRIGMDTQTQLLRDAQRLGVDVVELGTAYWHRIIRQAPVEPMGKPRIAGALNRREGYTYERAFEGVDQLTEVSGKGYVYEKDPYIRLAARLDAGIESIADAYMRRRVRGLPGAEAFAQRVTVERGVLLAARKAVDQAKKAQRQAGGDRVAKLNTLREAEAAYVIAQRDLIQAAKKVRAPGPGSGETILSNRIVPVALKEELEEFVGPLESVAAPNRVTGHLGEVAQLARTTLTTADLAAGFIQGQPLFYRNHLAWWKAQIWGVIAFADDPTAYVARNYDVMQRGTEKGAIMRPTEYLFAERRPGRVGGIASVPPRIPLIGRALKGFNRSFEWFIVIAQTELYKAAESKLLRKGIRGKTLEEELVSVGSAIRKEVGVESPAILGLRRGQIDTERWAFFASRFLRANAGIIAQAFTPGAGGAEARRVMGSLLAGATTLTIGIHYQTTGHLANYTDPEAPDWAKFYFRGRWYTAYGPFHPFLRTIARANVKSARGDVKGALLEIGRFFKTKAGIPIRGFEDLAEIMIRGYTTTFEGEIIEPTLSGAARWVAEFAPIAPAEVASGIQAEDPWALLEIAGISGQPESRKLFLQRKAQEATGTNRRLEDLLYNEWVVLLQALTPEEKAEMAEFDRLSANRGSKYAQNRIAQSNLDGLGGIDRDTEQAVPGRLTRESGALRDFFQLPDSKFGEWAFESAEQRAIAEASPKLKVWTETVTEEGVTKTRKFYERSIKQQFWSWYNAWKRINDDIRSRKDQDRRRILGEEAVVEKERPGDDRPLQQAQYDYWAISDEITDLEGNYHSKVWGQQYDELRSGWTLEQRAYIDEYRDLREHAPGTQEMLDLAKPGVIAGMTKSELVSAVNAIMREYGWEMIEIMDQFKAIRSGVEQPKQPEQPERSERPERPVPTPGPTPVPTRTPFETGQWIGRGGEREVTPTPVGAGVR